MNHGYMNPSVKKGETVFQLSLQHQEFQGFSCLQNSNNCRSEVKQNALMAYEGAFRAAPTQPSIAASEDQDPLPRQMERLPLSSVLTVASPTRLNGGKVT